MYSFDAVKLFEELNRCGVTSFPLLEPEEIKKWEEEVSTFAYSRRHKTSFITDCRTEGIRPIKKGSGDSFIKLGEDLAEKFNHPETKKYFPKGVRFNRIYLQKLPAGAELTPQQEKRKFILLSLHIIVQGGGELYCCENKKKEGSFKVPIAPGYGIIMRGSNSLGHIDSPYFYGKVQYKMFIISFRQKESREIKLRLIF